MKGQARPLATALLGVGLLGLVCTALFSPHPPDAAFATVAVVYGFTGWLIAKHQPDNMVAWLLLLFGGLGGLQGSLWGWQTAAGEFGLPGAALTAWTEIWIWAPMLGITFGPLLVLFPDGRLLSNRWAAVLWLSGAFVVLAGVGNALFPYAPEDGGPNPYAVEGFDASLRMLQDLGGLALMGALLGGVAGLAVRFRRADQVQRQQLKWFLTAAALLPVVTVAGELDEQALQPVAVPLGLSLIAVAMGIAILRHRLYDIDRIISRSLSWALVTVVIGSVYFGAVTLLTAATASVAGQSAPAVAVSTLLAAAAFGPVRRRIQSAVDRRFNRARYDAAQTVEAYRVRLRSDLDVESIAAHLHGAVADTLQPRSSTVWLRGPGASV